MFELSTHPLAFSATVTPKNWQFWPLEYQLPVLRSPRENPTGFDLPKKKTSYLLSVSPSGCGNVRFSQNHRTNSYWSWTIRYAEVISWGAHSDRQIINVITAVYRMYCSYHLVMTHIAMENPRTKWWFLAGKIHYSYGSFSMATLNNQRVDWWVGNHLEDHPT